MTTRPATMLLVRSQIGPGRVETTDTNYASAMPGVLAVLTHDDVPGAVASGRPVLAGDLITFQGQEVAAVVAENDYLAADAVEQVDVVIGQADASTGDDLRASAESPTDGTVSGSLVYQRWHSVPLQTQRCVATPVNGDRLRVQVAVRDPRAFAQSLAAALGLPEAAVEIEAPDDDGRATTAPDLLSPGHVLAAAAARRLGRAVRWQESRSESLTSGGAQAGFTASGHLTGAPGDPNGRLDLRLLADVGAYALPGSVAPASWTGLPWYGVGEVVVDASERHSAIPPAAQDSVLLLGQVALMERLIGALARADGTDHAVVQSQLADAGGASAAALLEAAQAMVHPAGGKLAGDQAHGLALAPGLAAAVRLGLDPETGEWRVDRVAIATSFALSRESRLAVSAGAVDGYGLASMQEISFDDQGNCLAATLMDYIMPSSWEAPPVELAELPDAAQDAPPIDTARMLATAAVAAAAGNAAMALVPGLDTATTPLTSAAVWERVAARR